MSNKESKKVEQKVALGMSAHLFLNEPSLKNKFYFVPLPLVSTGRFIFNGNLYFLVSKSLGFIPVMTLHFLHGVLVSFQCLGVLLFRCKPIYEQLFDILK